METMNAHNNPISEQFRLAAKSWVEADNAARMLEETKTAVLSQMMKALGDIPAAHAERDVKASPEWHQHISKMVEARSEANFLKVKMEFLRMKFNEQQSFEATARAERRL
jgi:hypothetical protein